MNRTAPLFLALTLSSLVLLACGGGGGGGATNTPPITNPPANPPPTSDTKMFTDIIASSGIQFEYGFTTDEGANFEAYMGGGVAVGDYDGDGDEDLFIVRGDIGANLLYRNDGDNTFVDVAGEAGVAFTKNASENYRHSGPTFADIDGDGDLDLFIGNLLFDPSVIYENLGNGTFADVTAGSGIDQMRAKNTFSAAFGDYDLDGDLDLLLSHWGTKRKKAAPGDTEHLWRNDSNPTDGIKFTSVSISAGISSNIITDAAGSYGDDTDYSYTPNFADINDDGYPDILMVGDFGTTQLFVNNQDGTFTNVTSSNPIIDNHGMGSAVGDFDNDGDLDWFVTSIYGNKFGVPDLVGNRLYQNQGGTFTDVTETAGVKDGKWGWGACFADFDLDGNLDIYHTNGWYNDGAQEDWARDPSRLFMSNGQGFFIDKASEHGVADTENGRGVVCADFDGDGDIDIFNVNRREISAISFFRNDIRGKNYLAVKLVGSAANPVISGARISVKVGELVQMREINIGSNYVSQNPTTQTFGLGENAQVDEIEIRWPNGTIERHEFVTANQTLTYTAQ